LETVKFVEFSLDGDPQVYKLAYDFNHLCDTEEAIDCNLMDPFLGHTPMNARQTRGILFACLKTAHPLVLLSEAGNLLSRDQATVLRALGKAIRQARAGELEIDGAVGPDVIRHLMAALPPDLAEKILAVIAEHKVSEQEQAEAVPEAVVAEVVEAVN
jgi:hypothetical protein